MAFQRVKDELRLLQRLIGVDRLREKVHTHVEPRLLRETDILLEIRVRLDLALGIAAVANADHGKLHPGGRNGLPVDVLLVRGHIDAHISGRVAGIADKAVLLVKLRRVIAVDGKARNEVIFRRIGRLRLRLAGRFLLAGHAGNNRGALAVVRQLCQQAEPAPDHGGREQHADKHRGNPRRREFCSFSSHL